MAHIKIEIDDKVLSNTEWPAFIPASYVSLPRVFKIENGDAKVFFAPSFYLWVPAAQFAGLRIDEPEEIQPAPNVGFSEGFVLRALAIMQDPTLAKELV